MTTAGGSGLDFGDDYVAARLSIDVPQEGIQGMRELTEGVERFRVAMEAATRGEADMTRYLDQMAESSKRAAEAQANLTQQLSTYLSMTGRMASGGMSTGVPGGTVQDPFGGMTAGMGMGGPMTPPGARQPNPSDVAYQLAQIPGTNPREYMNMQHARGGVDPGLIISPGSINSLASSIASREAEQVKQAHKTGGAAPPRTPPPHGHQGTTGGGDFFDKLQGRVGTGGGLAGSILNEIGGGNGTGFAQMALGGINAARKHLSAKAPDREGSSDPEEGGDGSGDPDGAQGGMSGMAKGLGVAGGVLTAGLTAFGLIQKGGAMVQGMRDIAGQRGGAGGEGFSASMKARGIGLDPFLSTDQGRQIVQAMISGGYADASGSGAEDLQNFLENNIKTFGMSVSESMKLLTDTAHHTAIGLDQLTGTLSTLKEASKNGYQSQADLQQEVTNRASSLISQGVNPSLALSDSTHSALVFNNDPLLAGSLAQATVGAANNTSLEATERLLGGAGAPAGLTPQAFGTWLTQSGKRDQVDLTVLQKLAQRAAASMRDTVQNKGGPGTVPNLNAKKMYAQLVVRAGFGAPYNDEQYTNDLYDKFIWEGKTPEGINKDANKSKAIADKPKLEVGERGRGYGGAPDRGGLFSPTTYGNTRMDEVLKAYHNDPTQLEVVDENGKATTLDTTSQQQMLELAAGKLKWRHRGDKGGGITLGETPDELNDKFTTDDPRNTKGLTPQNQGNPKTGTANVQIDLSPAAQKLLMLTGPNPVPLTPNDTAANAGQGGASLNNPPPGNTASPWRFMPR